MHPTQSLQPAQDHASGPSSSNPSSSRQRSSSPLKRSLPPSASSPSFRPLSMHTDSQVSTIPSPNKRPRPSLPPSSMPQSSSREPITISDDEDDDIEFVPNDENAAPMGERLPPAGTAVTFQEDDPMEPYEEEEEVEEGIEREEGDSEEDLDEEEEDEDEEDEEDDDDDAASEDLEVEFVSQRQGSGPPKDGLITVKAEPGEPEAGPSTLPDTATADGPVNALVAKKKRVRVVRSESVERPPPPPLDDIRLEIKLPTDGTTLEWDVLAAAEAKGLVMRRWNTEAVVLPVKKEVAGAVDGLVRSSSPLPGAGGVEAGETEEERIAREMDEKYAEPPKKRVVKRKPIDYDASDPFIDDSELQQDAPTHMAKTLKQGFFVNLGKVELLEEEAKPAAKPRPSNGPRKPPRASLAAGAKNVRQRKSLAQLVLEREKKTARTGSMMTPIRIDSDDDTDPEAITISPFQRTPSPELYNAQEEDKLAGMEPVDRNKFPQASTDPAVLPPWPDFPKAVRLALFDLRKESLAHHWDPSVKAKFPDHLKPFLEAAGEAAIRHGMFALTEGGDTRFFQALPALLPYNSFTLTKLTTKLCFEYYCDFLDQCEKAGLDQFAALVKVEAPDWKEKYGVAVKEYEEVKIQWEIDHPAGIVPSVLASTAPNMTADPSTDHPEETDEKPAVPADGIPKEPIKRSLWTADMRDVFDQLLDNVTDIVQLNDKAETYRISTNRTGKDWTESSLRLGLYKKITDLFPEGYVEKGQISREMSKIKAKKKNAGKQAAPAAAPAT